MMQERVLEAYHSTGSPLQHMLCSSCCRKAIPAFQVLAGLCTGAGS